MDLEEILLHGLLICSALYAIKMKRRKTRQFAVRPLNRDRNTFGHYETLFKFMKENDHEQFFKYTRMTPELFDHLLNLVGPNLQKTKSKNPLPPEQRLVMTLHYLSEGCSMQQIAWDYYVGKTTVHFVIKETCEVLWQILAPLYLPQPDAPELQKIAKGFFKRWNMPNCTGAVDGKHVIIQCPQHSGSDYFSYKKSFSLVLMGVCDAFYKFIYVDVGAAGSNHDCSIFKNSSFGKAILDGTLKFPEDNNLPGTNTSLPYFLVADQAFPLHNRIMRPYPGSYLDTNQNIFNYRLSRARRTIENTFGILVQRWRILRKPIIANIATCEQIVKAAIVLHNYMQKSEEDIPLSQRRYCPTGYADRLNDAGDIVPGMWRQGAVSLRSINRFGSNNSTRAVQENRKVLTQYFVSAEGSVPWQNSIVLRS